MNCVIFGAQNDREFTLPVVLIFYEPVVLGIAIGALAVYTKVLA